MQMMTAREYLETAPATDDNCEADYERMVTRRTPAKQALMDEIDAECHAGPAAAQEFVQEPNATDSAAVYVRIKHLRLEQTLVHVSDEADGSTYEVYRLSDKQGFVGTLQVAVAGTYEQTLVYWLTGSPDRYASRANFLAAYLQRRGAVPTRAAAHNAIILAQRRYESADRVWQAVGGNPASAGQRISDACRLKASAYAAWQQALRDYECWFPANDTHDA